jgi:hypothetical protein
VPNAAGHIRAWGGDFTVRDRERRTRRRFAATALGHDGDLPKPVIGGLAGSGSGGDGGCGGGEYGSKKNLTNAGLAHESIPRFCVMARLIPSHCVQNLLRCANSDYSHRIKDLIWELVSWQEQKTSPLRAQKCGNADLGAMLP